MMKIRYGDLKRSDYQGMCWGLQLMVKEGFFEEIILKQRFETIRRNQLWNSLEKEYVWYMGRVSVKILR